MTLRGRLTAAFLAVVLGPILVSAIAVGVFVTTQVRQAESDELHAAARDVRAAMVLLCERVRGAADALAVAANATNGVDLTRVSEKIAMGGAVDAVRIEDTAGSIVFVSGNLASEYRHAPWGECADDQGLAEPLISAGVPLKNVRGEQIGMGRAALLVDASTIQVFREVSGAQVSIETNGGSHAVGSVESDEASGDELAIRRIAPAPGQPFTVVVGVPRGNLSGLYVALALGAVAVTLLALAAVQYLARSLMGPLDELAHAAQKVSAGSLDTRVPVRGDDEIGRLARTFNRMLHDLQTNVRALTASRDQLRGHLVKLGQALASGGDKDRILELTLQAALASAGAQAGVVMLLEEQPPDEDGLATPSILVARAALGLSSAIDLKDLRVTVGDGVLGRVAERAAPASGRVEPGSDVLAPSEPPCQTYLAVPLLGGGETNKILGVLALYDRLAGGERVDEFDDSDAIALQNFANNAVAAL